jgi:branched-chain amino acid transport system substrate-binding protein
MWLDSLPEAVKPKTVGIVYASYSDFTISGARGDKEQAEALGMDVVLYEGYPKGTTDFSPIVEKAKAGEVEVWDTKSTDTDSSMLIFKALKDSGYQPKALYDLYVFYPGFTDRTRPGHQLPIVYYSCIPVWHWPTWPDPPYKDVKHWVDFYTGKSEIFGPLICCDWGPKIGAMQILEQIIQGVGSIEDADIKSYAEEHSFLTMEGRIEFEDRWHLSVGRISGLGQITRDGLEEAIWPATLATGPYVYPRPPWNQYT